MPCALPNANNTPTTPHKRLNIVSLCYGYGGLDHGLKSVLRHAKTVLVSEWDLAPVEILLRRMEVGEHPLVPIWTDLRTLPWSDLVGCVDILTGGFPCQPFSVAGARKADADPRHLFPYFKAAIAAVRPKLVFLENVPGILSARLGEGWADPAGTPVALHVIRELQRLGYAATIGIFSAVEIGLPHQRKRAFFAAIREDCLRNPIDHGLEFNEPEAAAAGPAPVGGGARDVADLPDALGQSQQSQADTGEGGRRIGESLWPSFGAVGGGRAVAGFGDKQHDWEFPRTSHRTDPAIIAPLGGAVDGHPPVVGFANAALCEPYYRKTGLRMCGNGVVPATAALAALTLFEELLEQNSA